MIQRIGIIGDALAPNFNEALANQMRLLSEALGAPVLTGNDLGFVPLKKMGKYLIVNTRFLREGTRVPLLSVVDGAFFYLLLKLFERNYDVVLLPAGINSQFLRHVNRRKCVLIINSMPFSPQDVEPKVFAARFAPGLRGIIVQSQRIRDRLLEIGVDRKKVHLIYPWVDLDRFRYTEPAHAEEFRVLFASAPNLGNSPEAVFEAKGISLLLESFKEFAKSTRASLYLVWRGHYYGKLVEGIKELDLGGQVKVINEVADMPGLYARSHVTVIPFRDTRWSPDIPLSAVKSLACGRPVVTTNVAEIAGVVQKYKCGCVVEPTKEGLVSGLVECRRNWGVYQKNCRRAAEELFSFDVQKFQTALAQGTTDAQ